MHQLGARQVASARFPFAFPLSAFIEGREEKNKRTSENVSEHLVSTGADLLSFAGVASLGGLRRRPNDALLRCSV